jgi:hypothetical protein
VSLEHGLAVAGQLPVEADPWRDRVPGEVVGLWIRGSGGIAVLVELVPLGGEGLLVIEAETEVERQAIAQPNRVVEEDAERLGIAAVAEGRVGDAVAVVGVGLAVGVDHVVVADEPGSAGGAVLDAEAEVVARAEELVGQVRDLGGERRARGPEVVPVVVPTGDEAGVDVVETVEVAGLAGIRRAHRHVGVEARIAHLDHRLVRQDAGVAQAGRGRLLPARGSRLGRGVEAEAGVVFAVVQVEGPDQLVLGVDLPVQLAEVAVGAAAGGGEGIRRVDADVPVVVALVGVGGEEPELVLDDRAPELGADVGVLVAREGAARVAVRAGVHEAAVGIPDGLGVVRGQAVRLVVEAEVAVELVRPLPGHDVVDGARQVAVLGGRAEREDLDLLDRVRVRLRESFVEVVVRDLDTVDLEGVLVVRGAVDHGAHGVVGVAARERARRRRHEIEEAVAAQRGVVHPLAAVVGADLVGGGVDHRRHSDDVDRLLELAHLERRASVDRPADRHVQASQRRGLEAAEAEDELVVARRQVDEPVEALLVGDRRLRPDDVGAAHGNGGVGQHGARRVSDRPRDTAGRSLCESRAGESEDRRHQHRRAETPSHGHPPSG